MLSNAKYHRFLLVFFRLSQHSSISDCHCTIYAIRIFFFIFETRDLSEKSTWKCHLIKQFEDVKYTLSFHLAAFNIAQCILHKVVLPTVTAKLILISKCAYTCGNHEQQQQHTTIITCSVIFFESSVFFLSFSRCFSMYFTFGIGLKILLA